MTDKKLIMRDCRVCKGTGENGDHRGRNNDCDVCNGVGRSLQAPETSSQKSNRLLREHRLFLSEKRKVEELVAMFDRHGYYFVK